MQQQRNFLIFILLAFVLYMGADLVRRHFFPPAPVVQQEVKVEPGKAREEKKDETVIAKLPAQPPVTEEKDLAALGSSKKESTYNLFVQLDPRGAGVREIILNKFEQASDRGKPMHEPLALVPASANLHEPAYLLYHYDPDDLKLDHPIDTLGKATWQLVKHDGQAVVIDKVEGKERQSVSFQYDLAGVRITKTYSLIEGDYHVGLHVDLERLANGAGTKSGDRRDFKFRYQLTGAKGLPIEGKWYTTTFRNALIGTEDDRGGLIRDFNELRQISSWGAGHAVEPKDGQWLRYAGVSVQYFASMIVVDDQQSNQKFLHRAQATLETAIARGKLKEGVGLTAPEHIVLVSEDGKTEQVVYVPADLRDKLVELKKGTLIAAVYRPLTYDVKTKTTYKEAVALHVGDDANATHAQWEDDITMRVTTDAVDLKPGSKVSHQYLLYNGPVKPSLLGLLPADQAVAPEVVNRYVDKLQLNSMTDHHSPGVIGQFANTIYWTKLLILFTNVMHRILSWLHMGVASYGLCIIFLTVMVRGLMFPLSRRQALMTMKMQALVPEQKKLQEKYKDDRQGLGLAQMELYRKHGVNPFGSCWVLLLQMPIFMGLYYALQESILFRLKGFWPTWIENLAAPDMLLWWGESIPWISRPQDYGSSIIYMGPYLNLLPIIAVSFMIVQQKMMMPPPTDEQQEMQQKMMKYMMVVFGFMFYKVAAGLCLYFIATTVWGFTERKLLPKAKPVGAGDDKNKASAATSTNGEQVGSAQKSTGIQPNGAWIKKQGRNKRKGEKVTTGAGKDVPPSTGVGRMIKRMGDWWKDLLEQARKK